jgi:hypothetical protein
MTTRTCMSAISALATLALSISCKTGPEATCSRASECGKLGRELTLQECVEGEGKLLEVLRSAKTCDSVADALEERQICASKLPCDEMDDIDDEKHECNAPLLALPEDLRKRCFSVLD